MVERKWNESKAQFENYCREQLKSIQVAVERKAKGSQAEDGYFMEHMEKLQKYFLTSEVGEVCIQCGSVLVNGKCESCFNRGK